MVAITIEDLNHLPTPPKTTFSLDSGYTSQQKHSTSSGESSSSVMPAPGVGSFPDNKEPYLEMRTPQHMLSYRSLDTRIGRAVPFDEVTRKEENLDDVFADDIVFDYNSHSCSQAEHRIDSRINVGKHSAQERSPSNSDDEVRHRQSSSNDFKKHDRCHSESAINTLADNSVIIPEIQTNKRRPRQMSLYEPRTCAIRRRRRGMANIEIPTFGLKRISKTDSGKINAVDNTNTPGTSDLYTCSEQSEMKTTTTIATRSVSMHDPARTTTSNGQNTKQRRRSRRKAVITPPTLAMDNDFYLRVDRDKRQQPPATRVRRRIRSGSELCVKRMESEGNILFSPQRLEPFPYANINPSIHQLDVCDATSRTVRDQTSSSQQYVVAADVHNGFSDYNSLNQTSVSETNDNNSSQLAPTGDNNQDNMVNVDIQERADIDTIPPPFLKARKKFVKPIDLSDISFERKNNKHPNKEMEPPMISMSAEDFHRRHQYADFNEVLKHIFSPGGRASARSFNYISDQCLAFQSAGGHPENNSKSPLHTHHRSFSEDSALDFYGLDRSGSLKNSPQFFTTTNAFFGLTSKPKAEVNASVSLPNDKTVYWMNDLGQDKPKHAKVK